MRTEDNIQIEGIMAFIDRDNIDTDGGRSEFLRLFHGAGILVDSPC